MPRPTLVLFLVVALTLFAIAPLENTAATPDAPNIQASDTRVIPRQVITIDVLEHPPESNPYELFFNAYPGYEAQRKKTQAIGSR